MSTFSKTLQTLRKLQSNVTQETVANAIGVSTSAYAMYERGEREPDIATLIKLADFFNVTLDFLLGQRTAEASEVRDGVTVEYIVKSDLSGFIEKYRKSKDLQLLCGKLLKLTSQQLRLLNDLVDQML